MRLCNTKYGLEPSPLQARLQGPAFYRGRLLDEALLHCTAPPVVPDSTNVSLGLLDAPWGRLMKRDQQPLSKQISRHDLHLPLALLCVVLHSVRGWFGPAQGRRSFYSSTAFKWSDPRDSTTQPCYSNFDNASTSNQSPRSHRKSRLSHLWLCQWKCRSLNPFPRKPNYQADCIPLHQPRH